jgi:hypothetical protein
MKKLIAVIIIVLLSNSIEAKTYYVKKTGNDALSGLSITNAWQTLSKVNSMDFNAADTILFEGGSVFNGGIYLSEEDSGTAAQPIFISSYGIGRASIFANKSFGIYAYNVAGISIDNINFEGLHPDSSNNTGIYFYTDNPTGKKYKHIWLSNLNVSGFKNGIHLGSYHLSYPGYSRINLTRLNVFNNLQDGLNTYDIADNKLAQYAHDSLYVGHCYFNNNGFSGLVLGGINGGLIERVKASRSGHLHNKGVVGIWAWSSRNLTFQYCIADSTKTDGGDGGGFDIDGGTENCFVQYCYSYFNDGPGYMHCDYPTSRVTQNNTIRYNISEYDGQQAYRDKSSLLFISWGSGLKNCLMYNNTSVIGNKANGLISGLQGIILDDYDTAPKINNCKAFNNIVYANGDSNFLLRIYNGRDFNIDTNAIQFAHNVYFAGNSASKKWRVDNSIYTDLNSWRSSSKQEVFKGKNVGWTINPLIKNPGFGGAIPFSKIDSLEYLLTAYTLLKTSPIIDSGLNINATIGADIGKFDFFKNASLFGYSQDIGCNETKFISKIANSKIAATELNIYPNPCGNFFTVSIEKQHLPASFQLLNLYGQLVLNGQIKEEQQLIDMTTIVPGSYLLLVDNLGQKTVVIQK